MSSNQTYNRPFWCPECDMSVHLLSSAAAGDSSLPPFCPHCHCLNLELMEDDDDNPTPTPATTDIINNNNNNPSFLDSPSFRRFFLPFFGDFSPSDEEDDDEISLYDSIIPTIKINCSLLDDDDDGEQLVCAVCKDEFVVGVEAKLLPCDHLFHPHCILPWLNLNHNSCPLCRFQLPLAASSNLDDVSAVTESESSSSSSSSGSSSSSIDCTVVVTDNFISNVVGFTHQDGLDCGFPDVGALSSFLPSHF